MTPSQAQQLTSYLYGLKTPEAVQQFAAQHQNDINVVGLASGVANAMKAASQSQQLLMPQGTVTQQAISQMASRGQMPQQTPPQITPQAPQMPPPSQAALPPQATQQLPENSGIAQLPVQNMQSMAGGGITGEPRRFAVGDLVPAGVGVVGTDVPEMYMPPMTVQERQRVAQSAMAAQPTPFPSGYTRQNMANDPRMISNIPTNLPTNLPNQTGVTGVPYPVTPGPQQNAPVAPAVLPKAPASGIVALPSGMQRPKSVTQNAADMAKASDPAAMHMQTAQEHSDELASLAAQNGVDLNNTKGYDQLDKLDKRSQDLLDRKSNLAIIQAGLGMIRSGNPFEAIAAGAGQGIKSYSDAMDQAQTQQAKLAESRMALDAATNAMKMGNVKESVQLAQKGKEMGLQALIANNHDAVSLTNNQAQVAAQLAGDIMRRDVGMAGVGVQQGMLGIAQQEAPGKLALMHAQAKFYNDRMGTQMDKATMQAVERYAQGLIGKINPATNQMYTPIEATMAAHQVVSTGGAGQLITNLPTDAVVRN
jgi:hypothetical protein